MGFKLLLVPPTFTALAGMFFAQTATSPALTGWESLGLGGFALSLAMWIIRDSQKQRVDDAFKYAQDLRELNAAHTQLAAQYNEEQKSIHSQQMATSIQYHQQQIAMQSEILKQAHDFYTDQRETKEKLIDIINKLSDGIKPCKCTGEPAIGSK